MNVKKIFTNLFVSFLWKLGIDRRFAKKLKKKRILLLIGFLTCIQLSRFRQSPPTIVNIGVQWSVVGYGSWQNSGFVETGYSPESYTIKFSNVTNWTKSNDITATVNAGQTSTYSGTYTNTNPPPLSDCGNYNDVVGGEWYCPALDCLTNDGIVSGDRTNRATARPTAEINKAELAKMVYVAANIPNLAQPFPTPFNDLHELYTDNSNPWYFEYVKNLSYLEYGDGIAPFDRNHYNFFPANSITRAEVCKVLIEAWKINVQNGTPSFTDVSSNHPLKSYIYTAEQIGMLNGYGSTNSGIFRPNVAALRAGVFQMIYNINCPSSPNYIPDPTVGINDFFIPPN